MGKFSDYIVQGLDEYQLSAVQTVDGPVRIIAGAGAGKTRTITRRIAYACDKGLWNPSSTLAVTYTLKAAREMKKRLASLGVSDVQTSTFHAAALSFLRTAWRELTGSYIPEVTDDISAQVVTALGRVTGLGDFTPEEIGDVRAELSWMKVNLISTMQYERVCTALNRRTPLDLTPTQISDISRVVDKEKSIRGLIDFDDILLLLSHIMDQYEEVAQDIRRQMKYITVDEYQDVSPLQHHLLTQWLGDNRNICVVGDPAQTIYSYAGASSYYLLNFDKEFAPLSADIELNTDYRSTGHIVSYANSLLSHSPQAADYLELVSAREMGQKIRITKCNHDEEEAQTIARQIQWLVQRGTKTADIAILTRIRAHTHMYKKALKELGIPAYVHNADVYETAPLIVTLKEDRRADSATAGDTSVAQAQEVVQSDQSDSSTISLDSQGSLEQPVQAIGALEIDAPVTISTIHSSKGLEWKRVFVTGCSDGLIPFGTQQANSDIEEERRVFYVAVTRGEDRVYLSYSTSPRPVAFGGVERMPSRFLSQAAKPYKSKVRK